MILSILLPHKLMDTERKLQLHKMLEYGALAQLGERIAGSDEVRGSIPLGSILEETLRNQGFFLF